MNAPAENDAPEWTGCVHCGQTLPHEGTSWRETYRCRLFQRIAERAWDEGFKQGGPMRDVNYDDPDAHTRNPYHATEGDTP